jgi:hypothetical protein
MDPMCERFEEASTLAQHASGCGWALGSLAVVAFPVFSIAAWYVRR